MENFIGKNYIILIFQFYRDTNGEANYSDSFNIDASLDEPSIFNETPSNARLGRTQEDLHKYKQRIDANVEQQREYSEIIAAMQSKVSFEKKLINNRFQLQEYRKHISKLQDRVTKQNKNDATLNDTSLFPFNDSGFIGVDSDELWNRGKRSEFITGDNNSNYETVLRLDEERRR